MEFFDRKTDRAAAVILAFVRGLITPGAEGPVTSACQDDAADFRVIACLLEGADQLVTGLAAKGVHLFGPVDGDPGDAVFDLEEDVGEVHFRSFRRNKFVLVSVSVDQPAIVSPPETESTWPVT